MPQQQVQHARHSQYVANISKWKKCRDVFDGEETIKGEGETYLPKLDGQTDAQYEAYKTRGRFYNAYNKTIKGHVGLGLRKPVVVDSPDSMGEIDDNIDRQGSDIRAHIRSVLEEVMITGRAGTLVDYTAVDSHATMADVKEDRPYWVMYPTEDILDWEYTDGNLTYLSLRELRSVRGVVSSEEDRYLYRVLEIVEGVYIQTVYEGMKPEGEVVDIKVNNGSIGFIPFIVHQSGFGEDVKAPPLEDLANLNLSHYRLKADHMHGLHYVALPTPWVTGVDEDNAPDKIGPEAIWILSNSESKVGMLEFTGQGLSAIKEELKSIEDQMAILGSRILLPELVENTATAAKLRSMSETSDLSTIIIVITKQLNRLYAFTVMWAGSGDAETEIKLDTNFLPKEMDAQMLTAMVGAWQASAFDQGTLVDNLQKAEIISSEKDIPEMLTTIEQEENERMEKAAKAIAAVSSESGDNDEDE